MPQKKGDMPTEVEQKVELRREELRPRKEEVQAGEVRVRKDIVEERQTKDVPLGYEEVEVDYRPIEPRPADRPVGADESIEVPVHQERITGVDKQPVVTGEIDLHKRHGDATERVSDTVRREEPRVEREGDLTVRGNEEIHRS